MSRENRRKEALHLRQFNFHRKKELPWQLFFNDSIHIFMDTPVAEDGLSVQGSLTKTQKAAPTAPNSGERPGFRAEES